MEKKEKLVALYVFIDEDNEEAIAAMLGALNDVVQEADLVFNSYTISVEEL